MSVTTNELSAWLDDARVADAIFEQFGNYQVTLVTITGIDGAAAAERVNALVADANQSAEATVAAGEPDTWPHIGAWRDAYRAFGAKPSRTRVSAEALIRRAAKDGLPRISPLVDGYNAISVAHNIPVGGEDLTKYQGSPFLVIADGTEEFHTTSDGEPQMEHPDAGEPIWCHGGGITCRRWNWRQSPGTAITDATTDALFIFDSLEHPDHARAGEAAAALLDLFDPAGERSASRIINAASSSGLG